MTRVSADWLSWQSSRGKAETTIISGELKVQDAWERGMMGVVVFIAERPPVIQAETLRQRQASKRNVSWFERDYWSDIFMQNCLVEDSQYTSMNQKNYDTFHSV